MNRLEFAKRIVESIERERVARNLSQREMAGKLDIALSSYKKIVGGETTRIDAYLLYKLHCLTGKFLCEFADFPTPVSEVIPEIRKLSSPQLRFVREIVNFELSLAKTPGDNSDMIPVFTLTGDMQDGMIYDSTFFEPYDISAYRQVFGNRIHCGVKITSNHLHPVYHIGDILLVCNEPPRDGDTGIFIHKDMSRAFLRKFRQSVPCTLEPINGYGQTFFVNPNDENDMNKWVKFGIVLAKIREQ